MTDLSTLLARVEAGSGADRETDIEIATTLGGWVHQPNVNHNFKWHDGVRDVPGPPPRYTTDLNAVIGLVEARMPDADFDIRYRRGKFRSLAIYSRATPAGRDVWVVFHKPPELARALLAALLRAEMEKQT